MQHLGSDWRHGSIHSRLGNAAAAAGAAVGAVAGGAAVGGAVAGDVDDGDTPVHEPAAAAAAAAAAVGGGGVVVDVVVDYFGNFDHLFPVFLEYYLEDYVPVVLYVPH